MVGLSAALKLGQNKTFVKDAKREYEKYRLGAHLLKLLFFCSACEEGQICKVYNKKREEESRRRQAPCAVCSHLSFVIYHPESIGRNPQYCFYCLLPTLERQKQVRINHFKLYMEFNHVSITADVCKYYRGVINQVISNHLRPLLFPFLVM